MLKQFLVLIVSLMILTAAVVTAKAQTTFSGTFSGAQVVPPTTSTAVGSVTVILNDAETRITISLDFSGLGSNATAAHIHGPGGPGANAPVLFNLGSQGTNNGALGGLSAAVNPTQVAQLRAGKWYLDVHSTGFYGGEIRAQILPGSKAPVGEEPPLVIRAVAPAVYPAIARQARAGGRVLIEVKIDAKGKVTSAKAVEGHPLLQKVAEAAATQWQFDSGADGRVVRLTFTFIVGDGETEKISFIPPYEVEFISRRP